MKLFRMFLVILATGFGLVAMSSTANAAIHYGEADTTLYSEGGFCTASLVYDGDLPGSGVIDEITTEGCGIPFFASTIPYAIVGADWEGNFEVDGSASISGVFEVEFSGGGIFECSMFASMTGEWDQLDGTFELSGPTSLISNPYLCSLFDDSMELNGYFGN